MEKGEKRNCPRISLRQPVAFVPSMTRGWGRDNCPAWNGWGIDLGSSGVGLEADFALEKGDLVKLMLPIPDQEVCLPVYAEVMWTVGENGYCRAGLSFL